MPRNENFDNSFWDDPDVEGLSLNATALYVWSWTNRRCGMAGMYKVSHRAMTESKVALQDIPATLEELAEAGFAFYEDQVLWVRSRVKRLTTRTSQIAKSVARDVAAIAPDHPLRVRFIETYGDVSWLREAFADLENPTLTRPSRDPQQNSGSKGESVRVNRPSTEGPTSVSLSVQLSEQKETLKDNSDSLPRDFPELLLPHIRIVWRVLTDLAVRHDAKAITPLGLGNVVMARSHKPLVRAAYDCAAHWDSRSQRLKDPLAAYRNWLDKTDDLAGYEQLTDDGLPASGPRNVVPLAGRRENASDWIRDINGLNGGAAAS